MTATQEWKQARDEARRGKEHTLALRKEFEQIENQLLGVEREITKARAAVDAHREACPKPEDFPTDSELDDWERQEQVLSAALEPLYERRRNLTHTRELKRMEAIRADQDFVRLQYAERNARAKAGRDKPEPRNADGTVSL